MHTAIQGFQQGGNWFPHTGKTIGTELLFKVSRKTLHYMVKLSRQNYPCNWSSGQLLATGQVQCLALMKPLIAYITIIMWSGLLHTYKVILSASMHISPTAKQTKTRTNIQYLHYLRFHLFLHTWFSICIKKMNKIT